MPRYQSGPGGINIENGYVREQDLIDQYVGNQLWLWGVGTRGRLGDNTTATKSSPVQSVSTTTNWKTVAAGSYHIAAIKTDGTLWTWGSNVSGQLGDNTLTHRSSPVQTVLGGSTWKEVACGPDHTAAIKTDGTLWLWGTNSLGELAKNDTTNRSSPVQELTNDTNWMTVSAGSSISAAIKADGTLWLWGSNNLGELGDNTTASKSSPVQTISTGTNWKKVAIGDNHTAAIKTDGTLWSWGDNSNGQLGDNTQTHRSSPVQTVSGGITWKEVACGMDTTAAIKTDGTLWLWGRNILYGQLGDNTLINKSSPVQTISGGTNWKHVTLGKNTNNTFAIKTDGTLWCWGHNGFGHLGDNTLTHRSSPVQTVAGGFNWKEVSTGCAVTFTES